jgi:hypothetical protein
MSYIPLAVPANGPGDFAFGAHKGEHAGVGVFFMLRGAMGKKAEN